MQTYVVSLTVCCCKVSLVKSNIGNQVMHYSIWKGRIITNEILPTSNLNPMWKLTLAYWKLRSAYRNWFRSYECLTLILSPLLQSNVISQTVCCMNSKMCIKIIQYPVNKRENCKWYIADKWFEPHVKTELNI
jgi:hypothetical protein